MILAALDLLASLLCSVTIFSVLGAMAVELGYDDIKKVVKAGVCYGETLVSSYVCIHSFLMCKIYKVYCQTQHDNALWMCRLLKLDANILTNT